MDPYTVLIALVAVEQVLANMDCLKANCTFQLICNITNSIVKCFKPPIKP